ncbi:unnamed protein product [Symbiodinium sp. CCMP2592]|nr:unnamed protein product [Symbiodinium sp. CCMP2592]
MSVHVCICADGVDHGYLQVYEAFAERERSHGLVYAHDDSVVKNKDQVSKLIRLLSRCKESGVLHTLQSLQLQQNRLTWAGRWSVVTRLVGLADDGDQFKFIVRPPGCTIPFRGGSAVDLTRDSLVDTAKALAFTFQVMEKVAEECRDSKAEPWMLKLKESLSILDNGSDEAQVLFGASDVQAAVLRLIMDLVPQLHCTTVVRSVGVKARMQCGSKGIRQASVDNVWWRSTYKTPLVVAAPAVPDSESPEPLVVKAKWNDTFDEEAPAAPTPTPSGEDLRKQREDAFNTVAKGDIGRYVRFIEVSDVTDPTLLSNALVPHVELLDIPAVDGSSEQSLRGWIVDSAMLHEPSEAFCKSHNVFTRHPPFNGGLLESVLKVYQQVAVDGKDIVVVMDSGSSRASTKINSAFSKARKHSCMMGTWQLLPLQSDLEARAAYLGQEARGQKRRRKASSLAAVVGQEGVHYLIRGGPLQSTDLKFLTSTGAASDSANPFLICSLPNPASLRPLVTKKEKDQVLLSVDKKDKKMVVCTAGPADLLAEVAEDEKLPLQHFSRHPLFYKELHNICHTRSLIIVTPDPAELMVAVEQKIHVIAVVRSKLHLQILSDFLREEIAQKMQDPTNRRFYQKTLVERFAIAPAERASSLSPGIASAAAVTTPPPPAPPGAAADGDDNDEKESSSSGGGSDEDD